MLKRLNHKEKTTNSFNGLCIKGRPHINVLKNLESYINKSMLFVGHINNICEIHGYVIVCCIPLDIYWNPHHVLFIFSTNINAMLVLQKVKNINSKPWLSKLWSLILNKNIFQLKGLVRAFLFGLCTDKLKI